MRRAVVVVPLTLLALAGCSDPDLDDLEAWLDRIDGHTVTYDGTISGQSGPHGPFHIVERDGEIVSAEYVGDTEPLPGIEPVSLTEALRRAIDDDPDELDVTETIGALQFSVDPDTNSMDEEWSYEATNIVIDDD
ncbi:MAG: hypothetical protein RL238_446 [Actinomycetota bacterium]|jgi:hypothetical protein